MDIQLLQCFLEAHLGLASWESMENLLDSTTGDQIEMKKGGGAGLSVTRVKIWADCIPACSCASTDIPASGSAHLQSQADGLT